MVFRGRHILSGVLGLLTIIALATVVAQVALLGTPRPSAVAAFLAAAAVTISWPLATHTPQRTGPRCAGCHLVAVGLGEFGFCTRCGSTKRVRSIPA